MHIIITIYVYNNIIYIYIYVCIIMHTHIGIYILFILNRDRERELSLLFCMLYMIIIRTCGPCGCTCMLYVCRFQPWGKVFQVRKRKIVSKKVLRKFWHYESSLLSTIIDFDACIHLIARFLAIPQKLRGAAAKSENAC